MKKIWILVLACVLLAAGCGKKQAQPEVLDLAAIQEAGVLRVGVTQCPPFCQQEDGVWTGFDVELAGAVCAELGVEPEFVELDWAARNEALREGSVDCLWSGLTARSDLTGDLDFSQTYLASRPALVTCVEGRDQMQTAELRTGCVIAVESGSAGHSAAEQCLPETSVLPVASQQAALEAVVSGNAQGAVVDLLTAQAAAAIQPRLTVLADVNLGTEELAVAVRHGSDLTPALNQALGALQQAGALDELAERYGLTESLIVG